MSNYLDLLRLKWPNDTDLQRELRMCKVRRPEDVTGLTKSEHRAKALKLMFPDRVETAWRRERIQSIGDAIENRIQEVGWAGSQNSNKTSDMADIALELWWENPESTTIMVAGPFRSAAESGIWTSFVEQFHSAKELHPELEGQLRPSVSKIMLYEKNPRSFIQVVTVDDIGKLVGKKSRRFGEGLMILMVDEAPNLPNYGAELISVLTNLRSVPNFLLLYSGNFADPLDAMGRLAEPVGGYDSIKGQQDTLFKWRTRRGGLVYRFDGHQSPNVLSGKDIYPFVTTISDLERISRLEGGTSSPGYMRFGRSFPVSGVADFRVTSSDKIEAGGARNPAHFAPGNLVPFSFCDPGFGGDPCVIQDLRVGNEIRAGRHVAVAELWGAAVIVPIDVGMTDASGPVSPERQIVQYHKRHAESRGIPARNCGFDGSLRAGIVHQYGTDWSLHVQPVEPQGNPTDRIFDLRNKRAWSDEVFNFASEVVFALALAIQSGQLRGLSSTPAAEDQLCRRPWKWRGDRKQIQPKGEFKAANQQKSPNEADALAGAFEIARRAGFTVLIMAGGSEGAVSTLLSLIREREQKAEVKRYLGGNALPPGRLRGIHADTYGRPRLNS